MNTQTGSNLDLEVMDASKLKAEVIKLRNGLNQYIEQHLDDACFEDVKLLCDLMPNGNEYDLKPVDPAQKAILMGRCSRFWDTRLYPANLGKTHEWGSVAKQGLYRHFKGGLYLVHGVALHSETGERLVVYRPLYGTFELMTRPEKMFIEEIDKPELGYKGPRFQFMSEMF